LFEESSIAAIAQQHRPVMLAEFLGTKTEFPPLVFSKTKTKVFFLAPNAKISTHIFISFIAPLGKQFSVPISRLYPTYRSRMKMGPLIKQIFESMLVIVDVTGKDPVLMYLLGIVKSLGRPLFILTQNLADIPNDLTENRHVKYEETEESLLDIQSQLSPVFEFIGHDKTMLDTKKLVEEQAEREKQKKKEKIQKGKSNA
jgi:hypothetical protein